MKRQRDSQRSKVYKSEQTHSLFWEKPIDTWDETCKWTMDARKKIAETGLYEMPLHFKMKDGRGMRSARGGHNGIKLPKHCRGRMVILHELAHHLTWHPNNTVAGHGWEFCKCYIDIAGIVLGKKYAKELTACFRNGKVKYKEPKKRILTEEQKQELRLRMLRAREVKMAARKLEKGN